MEKIKDILNSALNSIRPDKNYEKEIFAKLHLIIQKINKSQKYIKAILGGSGAKGTWLKAFDADIFVLFDYDKFKDKSEKLSDILEIILRKKFDGIIRLHGSRDYFQIRENGFTFEIVPILKILKAQQAKNITDVSPLHSRWVKKHKKLSDEIRLAKQFCHAQNIYGAESYIRGFSGYTCEILVVYYGSFLSLIRNAAKWEVKAIIDVEKYYRGKDVFKVINTSKLESPLIIIDPVQKDRNASAALSMEKFEKFKNSCREFLKNPSKDFFVKKDLKSIFLPQRQEKLAVIKAKSLEGKTDIVGGKLLKIYDFLKEKIQNCEFKILRSGWEWDKKSDAAFYFLFGKKSLSKNIEVEGPPLKIKNHVDNFKKMHKKTFVKSGKIMALEQRKFLAPEDLIKHLLKNEFVRDRCKSVTLLV